MNNKNIMYAIGLLIAGVVAAHPVNAAAAQSASTRQQCTSVTIRDTAFVTLGKSLVVPFDSPVQCVIMDGPPGGGCGTRSAASAGAGAAPASATPGPGAGAAPDSPSVGAIVVQRLSPRQLLFRGKRAGSTNVVLQDEKGACFVQDIIVSIDPGALQSKLTELMPDEKGIYIKTAENAVVLTGSVSNMANLDEVIRLASAYGDGKRVVNLLRANQPQQVMLEVKIAEVSKNLLDRFDINVSRMFTSADGLTAKVLAGIFGGKSAFYDRSHPGTPGAGGTNVVIDAQKKDGLVRILAEPNIMAISGQDASFLSGGKIFIPVNQAREFGGTTVTLAEKEFGVGLKFTPTVLSGTRINLKLTSEVSELSQTGSPFTTIGGVTSVLPSITTRRVDTTIQLNDGQSFAVAGLIRNNVTQTLKKFPGLGEVPILGMLFRSTEFQNDQTELLFIVTPRLVKPMAVAGPLPTENHTAPGRADALFMGAAEATSINGTQAAPRK